MYGLPGLPAQERLATTPFWPLILYVTAKVCANQLVSSAYIELVEEERYSPVSALNMHHTQNGCVAPIRLLFGQLTSAMFTLQEGLTFEYSLWRSSSELISCAITFLIPFFEWSSHTCQYCHGCFMMCSLTFLRIIDNEDAPSLQTLRRVIMFVPFKPSLDGFLVPIPTLLGRIV